MAIDHFFDIIQILKASLQYELAHIIDAKKTQWSRFFSYLFAAVIHLDIDQFYYSNDDFSSEKTEKNNTSTYMVGGHERIYRGKMNSYN